MSKQDGYASRTPADLERKYKFGETFAEVFGLVSDARKIAEEAQSAIEGLDQEQIFNLLTNNGKAQGIYRDDNGDVYVNASFIRSGTLSDEQLPNSVALKSEIPKALSELVNDKGFVAESGVTTIVKGVVTTDYVNALGLKVKAANITGTLTIGQLPSTVAVTSQIPTKTSQLTNNSGFVDSNTVTTITNNAIKTASISADQITGGTIDGISITGGRLSTAVQNATLGNITIENARINFGGAVISRSFDRWGNAVLGIRSDDFIEIGNNETGLPSYVRIMCGNWGYWEFTYRGINFYSFDGSGDGQANITWS